MIVMRKDQGTPLEVGEARCHITLASDRDTAAAATNTALSITGIMQDGAHVSLILQTDEAAELFALLQAADAADRIRDKAEFCPKDPARISSW